MRRIVNCFLVLAVMLVLIGSSSQDENLSQEDSIDADLSQESVTTDDYEVKCEYLKNPDAVIAIADKCAAF